MTSKMAAAFVFCVLNIFRSTLHSNGQINVSETLPQLRTLRPIVHVVVTIRPPPTPQHVVVPLFPPSEDIVIKYENKSTSFLDLAGQLNDRFGPRLLEGCGLQSSRSCNGRCGKWERNKRLKCYCDELCQELGDCCHDYYTRCGKSVFRKANPPMHSCFKPKHGFERKTWDHGHFVISNCPFNTSSKIVQACRENDPSDAFKTMPVFDKTTKKSYRNYFCAACNGATNITYWKAEHGCTNVMIDNFNSFNLTSFLRRNCKMWSWQFVPPVNDITDYCLLKKHKGWCNKSNKSNEMNLKEDICKAYILPVCLQPTNQNFGTMYNNPHCLLCDIQSEGSPIDLHCLECPQMPTSVDPVGMHILFDFSSSEEYKLTVGWEKIVVKTTRCKVNQVYDPFSRLCRDVPEMLPLQLKKKKSATLITRRPPLLRNSSVPSNNSIITFSPVPEKANLTANDSLAKPCVPVFFSSHEVEVFPNGSLYISTHERMYQKTSYVIHRNGIVLCTNFSQNYTTKSFIKSKNESIHSLAFRLITYVGGALSILSLLILIAVYVRIKEIKKLPGKIVMSLSCALLVFQVVFFLNGLTGRPALCSAVAVVLHYFLLASFTWMNVLAVDMAFTFASTKRGMVSLPDSDGVQRVFLKYCCHGWITPMVWVGVCVSLEWSHAISIGYGSPKRCWISNGEALLYVVCVPVATILVFNLAALVLSVVAIRQTRQNTRQVSKDSKPLDLPLLSLKLTVIFGLTWALGFAAAFEETAFIWYPFVILNSLQGALLFLALKLHVKVYHLLKGARWNNSPGVNVLKYQARNQEDLQLKQLTAKPNTDQSFIYTE